MYSVARLLLEEVFSRRNIPFGSSVVDTCRLKDLLSGEALERMIFSSVQFVPASDPILQRAHKTQYVLLLSIDNSYCLCSSWHASSFIKAEISGSYLTLLSDKLR
ncbi:hypothetical protein WA026_003610 [Henosepilachna vigintioctopunctata]|uniref:Uncharacterized protein n=1 Tax=Henosepilachna vigintioctopunctata TaxID=420089 RepID=A0AAW1TJC0_9CUCU